MQSTQPQEELTISVPAGVLSGFTLASGGSGYTTPAIVITGGGGSGAQGVAHVSQGVITAVDLISGGTGYTSVPTVTARDPDPRASGAIITAVLPNPAPTINMGLVALGAHSRR